MMKIHGHRNAEVHRWALCLLVLVALPLGKPARAGGSAAPGQAVGHVFLGMDRADVWKILHKPGHTRTVPHGMSLYGEDTWTSGSGNEMTVISERDKVIQVEFDSPRITTTDGLSTRSSLAQVRRRHPAMTVRAYGRVYRAEGGTGGYYIDDVRRGIAFTVESQESIVPASLNGPPTTIIVHRPGYQAVPIQNGRWSNPALRDEDPNGLHLLRSWFTPGSARPKGDR